MEYKTYEEFMEIEFPNYDEVNINDNKARN
jgi:hypothetical protein